MKRQGWYRTDVKKHWGGGRWAKRVRRAVVASQYSSPVLLNKVSDSCDLFSSSFLCYKPDLAGFNWHRHRTLLSVAVHLCLIWYLPTVFLSSAVCKSTNLKKSPYFSFFTSSFQSAPQIAAWCGVRLCPDQEEHCVGNMLRSSKAVAEASAGWAGAVQPTFIFLLPVFSECSALQFSFDFWKAGWDCCILIGFNTHSFANQAKGDWQRKLQIFHFNSSLPQILLLIILSVCSTLFSIFSILQ